MDRLLKRWFWNLLTLMLIPYWVNG
jgi:hypothetical protein